MSTPDVDHTPAGGSPPRPVLKVGDKIEVVKLPDVRDERLRMGDSGVVVEKREAMFRVLFRWGYASLNAVQIELLRTD